jgi:hypothetical protein
VSAAGFFLNLLGKIWIKIRTLFSQLAAKKVFNPACPERFIRQKKTTMKI